MNLLKTIISKSIKKSIDNRIDMIYEATASSCRLQCINENVNPIINLNTSQDIEVFVGERPKSLENNIIKFPKTAKNKYAIFLQKSLKTSFDVIKVLSNLISLQSGVSNYIVTIRKRNGQEYVELLEETGAA